MNDKTKDKLYKLLQDSAIALTHKEKEIVDNWKHYKDSILYDEIEIVSTEIVLTKEELVDKIIELDSFINKEFYSGEHESFWDIIDYANMEKFRQDAYDKRRHMINYACVNQICEWIRKGKDIKNADIDKIVTEYELCYTWEQVEKELREEFLNE